MEPYHPNAGSQNYNNAGNSKLAGLNGLPSDYEMALQQQRANGFDNRGAYDFQADLDMFTNTQFFDFDMAEVPETNSPIASDGDMWGMNNGFVAGQSNQQQPQNFNAYNTQPHHHPHPICPTATASSTPSTLASPTTAGLDSKTRAGSLANDKASASTTASSVIGEDAREAAEEDKRRRNTAASARFRVKKKQREQALEKTSKEMSERVSYLEQRVQNLEMENKLLKDLITEKNGVVPDLGEEVEGSVGKANAVGQRSVPAKRKEVKIETKGIS